MHVHLPGSGAMTMIENTFIDQFMPSASGDFVKIYLFLMRCAQRGETDITIPQVADALNYTDSDVERAMGYWQRQNLLDVVTADDENVSESARMPEERTMPAERTAPVSRKEERTAPAPVQQTRTAPASGSKVTEFRTPAKHSGEDIRRLMFVAENYLGRLITPSEQRTLLYFLDDLGMDIDLIDYLLEYCVSQNHTSFHYIQKVAQNWISQGIRTAEDARRDGSWGRPEYFSIFRALGIQNRVPTPIEITFMDRWMNEYHLPMDVILEACRRTILQIGKALFPYTDSILSSWSEHKVSSIEDVAALDREHEQSVRLMQSSPNRTQNRSTAGRFLNFEPSGTDWDDVADQVMQAQERETQES